MKGTKSWLPLIPVLILCVFVNLDCKTPVPDERAIKTEIISDPPGARIEVNGEYVGDTPIKFAFHQDQNRKIIGNYVIKALPREGGQFVQIKHLDGPYVPGTGRADKVPQRILFDMRMETASGATSSGISQDSGKPKSAKPKTKPSGTGFAISEDGHVLTCYHVVENAERIRVRKNFESWSATMVRKDLRNDLALLKLDSGSFSNYLPVAESTSVKLGDAVFTIGFPNPDLQGIQPKLTDGVISSLTGFQDDSAWFQISVPTQPGNSGGPLLSKASGEVVGVVVAGLSYKTVFLTGALPENVNYAIKSSYVRLMLHAVPGFESKLPEPVASKERPFEDAVKAAESAVVIVEAE